MVMHLVNAKGRVFPILTRNDNRTYATIFKFCAGVMPSRRYQLNPGSMICFIASEQESDLRYSGSDYTLIPSLFGRR